VRIVFADTFYWVALINPRDHWHQKAVSLSASLKDTRLITTEAVLIELLNYFAGYGAELREAVVLIVRYIERDSNVLVYHHNFQDGLRLYKSRLDKGYSMTDCMSMSIMRDAGVTEVLTHDRHFAQEGFVNLL
jgi:predicted nucleic acid-binding protein